MNIRLFFMIFILHLSIVVVGCGAQDGNYIPFELIGFDAWVYDEDGKKDLYAGRIEVSYWNKNDGLRSCAAHAHAIAEQYHLKNWGYVCCTVTSSSDCVTKVR